MRIMDYSQKMSADQATSKKSFWDTPQKTDPKSQQELTENFRKGFGLAGEAARKGETQSQIAEGKADDSSGSGS